MGLEANFVAASIPKFDGDYDHWSMVMQNLLRSKEYWVAVESGYTELKSREGMTAAQITSLEEMKLKDLKAKNHLFRSLNKSILKTITQKETSKQLWDSMKLKCQGNARVKRAQLNRMRRDFEEYGEDVGDVKIVEKILRTLTDKWNYIVYSIEEAKDIDQLYVDALQSSLLVHEKKFKTGGEDEHALKITHEGNYGGRGQRRAAFRGGRGQGRGRGRQPWSKETVECYKCHKLGHFQYEC
ncbi:uncharacterized protein LOC141701944 [Apium graveolens]|uniref:uncharacterized protein LOC141701944 n=1 Tax=Apium graveolens TaxID=4045 RepID=UPI003D7AE45F